MGMIGPTTFWSSYTFWTGSSIAASILAVKTVPEYAIQGSIAKTAIVLFFIQWLVYGFYAVLLYPKYFSPLRGLPMVTEGNHPIMGQWYNITKNASGDPARVWLNSVPNEGMIRYLGLFNRERILLTQPKALAEVLNTKNYEFQRPQLLLRGIMKILGVGLLLAEGDDHKFQRKGLMPAFAFRHIKELYPIFWSKSREMVRAIEEQDLAGEKPSKEIEIGGWASRAALDIIGLGGMGQDFNSLADPDTELNNTYRKVFSPSRQAQLLGLLSFFVPGWIVERLPIKRNDDIMAASKLARDTARNLVRQKKTQLSEKREMNPDIISIALESGERTCLGYLNIS